MTEGSVIALDEAAELLARDECSTEYHAHPSHTSGCRVYREHYNRNCPCEENWREYLKT